MREAFTESETFSEPELAEDEFISLARERRAEAYKADEIDRNKAELDVEFEAGKQWHDSDIESRRLFERPILTWNRMHTFVQQVANDCRQNKPGICATPGDGGSQATSDLKAARIRQIEYESDADIAYDSSAEQQIICGRGFYRITTKWVGGKFRQEPRLEPIHDQFSVLFDPAARVYDRSDAEYCFVETVMSKKKYWRTYGKATPLSRSDFFIDEQANDKYTGWLGLGPTGDDVRVAEYWLKEYRPRMRVELMNGESRWKDEIPAGTPIKNEREELDYTVYQYIIDCCSILKKTEWLGSNIPIVPVWGRQKIVKGRMENVSLIREGHDAQRLVNLYVSNIAEQIGLMPKSPYVAYEGTLDGHESAWEEVNNIPKAFLYAKPVFINGMLLPLPQRVANEPPIQALAIGLGQAVDALKAAMNIYDASLGAGPVDASARALTMRNNESDTGNYHFANNQQRSRKYAGRMLLELIEKLESQNDKITVRHIDGKVSTVPLRKPVTHTDGTTVTHDLSASQDEPHIISGASYTSQKQQAFAIYSEISQRDPNFMVKAGDILFRNLDAPGSDEIAQRYKATLPPQLLPAGDPAQLKQQRDQAMGMIKQLSATVHQLQNKLDAKQVETQGRIITTAMQEQTKRQNIQVQATIAEANLGLDAAIARLQEETDAIQHSMNHTQAVQDAEFQALLQSYQPTGEAMQDAQDAQDSAPSDTAQ